jgi:YidB-like protein
MGVCGTEQADPPHELEAALGQKSISWLMQQTGLSRDELLQGLSRELPGAINELTIDELTPAGRLPSENDAPQIAYSPRGPIRAECRSRLTTEIMMGWDVCSPLARPDAHATDCHMQAGLERKENY